MLVVGGCDKMPHLRTLQHQIATTKNGFGSEMHKQANNWQTCAKHVNNVHQKVGAFFAQFLVNGKVTCHGCEPLLINTGLAL